MKEICDTNNNDTKKTKKTKINLPIVEVISFSNQGEVVITNNYRPQIIIIPTFYCVGPFFLCFGHRCVQLLMTSIHSLERIFVQMILYVKRRQERGRVYNIWHAKWPSFDANRKRKWTVCFLHERQANACWLISSPCGISILPHCVRTNIIVFPFVKAKKTHFLTVHNKIEKVSKMKVDNTVSATQWRVFWTRLSAYNPLNAGKFIVFMIFEGYKNMVRF